MSKRADHREALRAKENARLDREAAARPVPAQKLALMSAPAPGHVPVSLKDLDAGRCRCVVAGRDAAGLPLYCGAEDRAGTSWCDHHGALAHVAGAWPPRPADAAAAVVAGPIPDSHFGSTARVAALPAPPPAVSSIARRCIKGFFAAGNRPAFIARQVGLPLALVVEVLEGRA